ncbi:hypothetical protein A0H81_13508 [Grifola frondosa]|uniref:DUF6535 domain-containing protein n=1 Tax=Grifola frondosa TaxID=5627 RepID=A0A1C7LPL6_GRIFR|nr:hypothetical protein A0H81_13508 [Grifola frondosa]
MDTDDAPAAWGRCAEILHDNDKSLLQGWKEEIDTLLVFSYQLLQPDTGDASVALLMQISMQLNSFTVNPSFINSTHPASLNMQSTFTAPAYAVRINTLWFASLVFSLASASIGISVKQWLNQYSHEVIGYPRSHENARLRQYRYESLVKWRVLAILPLIPLLLQISLALFLVGLVDLLWNIHHAVAAVVTVFVAMLLLFSTFTIVLPSFTCDCFYKSPQALGFFLLVQQMLRMWRALCHVMLSVLYPNGVPNSLPQTDKWLLSASMRHIYYSWREQERESVRKLEPVLDSHILTTCDAIKMDDDFLEKTIEPCFRTLDVAVAASCYDDILRHRAEDLEQLHQTWTSSRGVKSVNATLSLTLCALDKLSIGGQQYREDKLRISALLIYIWRWIGSLSLQYPVMARLWIVVADMSADERSLRVMLPFWKFFMCNHDLVPVASDGSEGGECVDSSALPDQETEMKPSGSFEGYEASPSPGLPPSPQLQQRTPARFETSSYGGGVAGS